MILPSSLVFIVGLIFGSFLNVVIYRLKSGQDVFFGRSFCPECKTQLKWYDLIPIFSFIYLRGRCRYCHKQISWQYPIVEILSGLIWVGVFYKVFGFQPPLNPPLIKGGIWGGLNFIYYIFILSSFLIIAVYDANWKIIPNKIVYPAITVALMYSLFNAFKFQNIEILKSLNLEILKYLNFEIFIYHLFAAMIAFLFFFLIYFFSKGKAMGLGDAKLGFLIAMFLGPSLAFFAFTLSFILGAVYAIILLILGKKTLKDKIALAPFLGVSTAIIFFL